MRLLQLTPNGNDASALDFHPMVTVVTQLTPAGRARVIDAITALHNARGAISSLTHFATKMISSGSPCARSM